MAKFVLVVVRYAACEMDGALRRIAWERGWADVAHEELAEAVEEEDVHRRVGAVSMAEGTEGREEAVG